MAPTIPTAEPARLVAGDTWQWTRPDHPDYPIADGWTLSYEIRGTDALVWDASYATQDGATWTITIPASATDLTVSGGSSGYLWAAIMTGTGAYAGWRRVVASGRFQVLPNLVVAKPGDLASADERDLAAVNAVLAGRFSSDLEEYTIGGRSVTKIPIAELLALRTSLEVRVWRLNHPGEVGPAIAWRFAGTP